MSESAVGFDRPSLERATGERVESWLSWAGALSLLVLVVWLVPIKTYKLPVALPFSLEIYRLLIIVLVGVWIVGIIGGTLRVSAAGMAKPLALLAAVGTISVLANAKSLSHAGLETQAIKSLTYFLSFLLAYLLVCSTIDSLAAVELVVRAFVLGGAVIAVFAVYEARTGYDVFDHLHKWFSFMQPTRGVVKMARPRGGRLRVHASAQHPIALGAALAMTMPLALYLASRAKTGGARLLWGALGGLVIVGALTTISRTVVLMGIAMVIVALIVRRDAVRRFWPALIVVLAALHIAAPHTLGSLYHSFDPRGGLLYSQTQRSNAVGSGRIADIGPGLHSWGQAPLFGHGLGVGKTRGSVGPGAIINPKTGAPIIFDDQYLNSLVSIGFLGLFGVIWFVWGSVVRLVKTARRLFGPAGDLVAACAVACAGFGAGMLTFDAFAFVQCTLLFFVIAAIGLRARALTAA